MWQETTGTNQPKATRLIEQTNMTMLNKATAFFFPFRRRKRYFGYGAFGAAVFPRIRENRVVDYPQERVNVASIFMVCTVSYGEVYRNTYRYRTDH